MEIRKLQAADDDIIAYPDPWMMSFFVYIVNN